MAARPVIGLTGGIGSGKSTVATMLAERGAFVLDADKVGHEIYAPGTEGFRAVVEAFGPDVVGADGAIDRRALAARVFGDRAALARLNAIVHPLIGLAVRDRVVAAQSEAVRTPIVIEASLIMEAGWQFFDEVWVVSVRPETAIARCTASRDMTRADVEQRLAAQMPDAERRRRATRVIENDGTPAELQARVEAAWRAITRS